MIWTDQMQLTPERLNDLQKRADSQAFVIFDINKSFFGSQVQEAINNGQLIFIKSLWGYGDQVQTVIEPLLYFELIIDTQEEDDSIYKIRIEKIGYIQSILSEDGKWRQELS